MRITKINIPEIEFQEDGLGTIIMDRLGDTVLIAGRNGSGKTRLLNRIRYCITNRPDSNEIMNLENNLRSWIKALENQPDDPNAMQWKNAIENNKKRLCLIDYITFSEEAEKYIVVDFVPKKLELADSGALPLNTLIERANNLSQIGVSNLADGAFARIQFEQNAYWQVTHPEYTIEEVERNRIIESYKAL